MTEGGNEKHGTEMGRYFYLFILAIIAVLLVSCNKPGELVPPVSGDYPPVDSLFREYYDQLGGLEALGPAISEKFPYEGLECQFTAAGLMVYDPQETERQRFQLAPIGLHMNIAEPPVPQPDRQDVKYVDGHIIFEKFVPLYEQMGGGLVVGKPLTELHFNPTKLRYEQYFENVGFYILEQDAESIVRLLFYGDWYCPLNCKEIPPGDGTVILPHHTAPEFLEAVSRLGPTFTGFAISDDYPTPDGYTEQVFENVVLISDPNMPGGVILRALTERLGYLPEPPVEPSEIPGMIFYPTQEDGRGYHVPKVFTEYIALHGGQELFGQPIDQRRLIKDGVYRQCFQNVCLEEHLSEFAFLRVRPSPLGYSYKEMAVTPVYPSVIGQNKELDQIVLKPTPEAQEPITSYMPASQPAEQIARQEGAPQISIQVWESFAMVAPGGYQEIGVSVYENNSPLKGIEPDLYVSLPDGAIQRYYMYPTGEDGQSRLVLDPIDAKSGTTIPYEVCIFLMGGQNLCVKDSFLIW